jgi:hypothetical protein
MSGARHHGFQGLWISHAYAVASTRGCNIFFKEINKTIPPQTHPMTTNQASFDMQLSGVHLFPPHPQTSSYVYKAIYPGPVSGNT